MYSDRHFHFDRAIRLVIQYLEVFEFEVVDVGDVSVNLQFWERLWGSFQLDFQRVHVVRVDVGVPHDMDELPGVHVDDHCDHVCQEGVGGDIEGDTEPHVARSLVHLAAQPRPAIFREVDVELAEDMAGRQRHLLERWGVPRGHDDSPVVGVCLQRLDDSGQLVVPFARVVCVAIDVVRSEVSPLEPVHGSQVSLSAARQAQRVEILSGPVAFPDLDSFFRQEFCVRGALDEPQQLLQNALHEHLFRCEQRERSVREIESQLWWCKQGQRSGSCSIWSELASLENPLDQVQIRLFFSVFCHRFRFCHCYFSV